MTPLPKRKWSKRRQGKKRASFSVPIYNLITCPSCQGKKLSHKVCPSCGQYDSKIVIVKKEKKKKTE